MKLPMKYDPIDEQTETLVKFENWIKSGPLFGGVSAMDMAPQFMVGHSMLVMPVPTVQLATDEQIANEPEKAFNVPVTSIRMAAVAAQTMFNQAGLVQAALMWSQCPSKAGANAALNMEIDPDYDRSSPTKQGRAQVSQLPIEISRPGTTILAIIKSREQPREGDPRRAIAFPFRTPIMQADPDGIELALATSKFWHFYKRIAFEEEIVQQFYLGHRSECDRCYKCGR